MDKRKTKFIVGCLIIVAAIGYLVKTSIDSTSVYYLTVSELLEKGSGIYGEAVRVEGKVVEGSINKISAMEVNFSIADDKKEIKAHYKGIIPDMFKDKAPVVLEGKFESTGIFKTLTLMTSCPSKYEEEEKENKIKL